MAWRKAGIAAVAVLLAAALAVPLPAGANHVQTASGRSVAFDHRTGNEWWVEVTLSGADAATVAKVEAMDPGGPWVTLEKKSWGAWAASFRIEPGNTVTFRASWPDAQVASCPFTHPAGLEQCGSSTPTEPTPPPPTPPPTDFDATFSGVKGNEWWVQAQVTANGAVAGVDVRVDAGTWKALKPQSWGPNHWAASYHIVQGATVQLRATSDGGATDLSPCYRWIPAKDQAATAVDCGTGAPPPPTPPPSSSGFSPVVSGVSGNAWWVQASVQSDRALAGVDVRADGGTWTAMAKQSWGAWATSTALPQGTLVQLRVRAVDGATFVPHNGWVWTSAQPFPQGDGLQATFENQKGNTGWVQTNVYASARLGTVAARVDDGAWQPLARQPYGDWAAGIQAPSGSHVQFRACDEAGTCVLSGDYAWPPGPLASWPVAGVSYATYHVEGASGSPGGDFWDSYEGTIEFRYTTAGWKADCAGVRHHFDNWGGFDNTSKAPYRSSAALAPPMWPTKAYPTQDVTRKVLGECSANDFTTTVVGGGYVTTLKDGRAHDAPAWHASYEPCPCAGYEASWARNHGLLLDWWFGGRGGNQSGHLVATDAPI